MQDYMISTREEAETTIQPEEVVDEALKNYREILLQKEEKTPRRLHVAFYSTSFLLILTICVLGINMLNNYDKMKKLEGAISVLSGSVTTETEADSEKETEESVNRVVIETVEGNITKNTEMDTEKKASENVKTDGAASTETVTKEPSGDARADNEAPSNPQAETDSGNTAQTDAPAESPDSSDTADAANTDAPAKTLTEAETIRLQGYYIVQKGENLAAISRKIYGDTTRMEEICAKNSIENSDQIYAGQKLILP